MTARVTFTNGSVLNASSLTNSFEYLPYVMESGTVTGTGSATITFTTGRFNVAPLVFLTVVSGSNAATSATLGTVTTSGAPISIWSGTAASTSSRTVNWTAIQMTATTKEG